MMREPPVDDDPGFNTEVDALLRPGNPELFRGVRRETLALMGLEPPPRRKARYVWYSASAAIAATVVLFLVNGPMVVESNIRFEDKLSGQIEMSRGMSAKAGVPTYNIDSILQIDIQTNAESRAPAEDFEVFEIDAEQKLRRLSMDTERFAPHGEAVSFRARARIRDIFDDRSFGKKTLFLIVGRYSSDLLALDGAPYSDVESQTALHGIVREIAIALPTTEDQ